MGSRLRWDDKAVRFETIFALEPRLSHDDRQRRLYVSRPGR